jgi:hypothetical protein
MKIQLMKIQFSLAKTYELTLKLIYMHKLFFISSKVSQSKQALSTKSHDCSLQTQNNQSYDKTIIVILS